MNALIDLATRHERVADDAMKRTKPDEESARWNLHLAAVYRDRARVMREVKGDSA